MASKYDGKTPEEVAEVKKHYHDAAVRRWKENYEKLRARSGPKKGYVWSEEMLQKFRDRSKKWTPEDRAQRKEWSKKGGLKAAELRRQNPNWAKEHSERVKATLKAKKEKEIWENLLAPLLSL